MIKAATGAAKEVQHNASGSFHSRAGDFVPGIELVIEAVRRAVIGIDVASAFEAQRIWLDMLLARPGRR